ncbi:MAG TPA: type II secretion system protein [Candidatus Xenobia bacterium]|jgi:prepilin-type N-terminal cleavage/methylation domain-containing protein
MRARGFTVIEMLVVCVLISVILGTAWCLLFLGRRSWNQVATRASLAVNAEVALERMRRDLQDSSSDGVTCTPNAVGFPCARDPLSGIFQTNSQGQPIWQSYRVYYVDTHAVLRERQAPLPGTRALSAPDLLAMCDGTGHGVAYDIAGMTATLAESQMTLSVACQAVTDARTERLAAASVFSLRNSMGAP